MARTALLNVMVQAALKAGRGLARDFGEVENLQVSVKGPGDFVSAADRRAEATLIAELNKSRPAWPVLTEESGEIAGTDKSHRFIVDPLDGTTNFLHGIPLFAISLGVERDGQLIGGVIFNPVLNELYVAERGGGAFLNDRRLRVGARRALLDSVLATGLPPRGRPGRDLAEAEIPVLTDKAGAIRRCGAAALDLAWLAAGRFDGYWQRGLSPWDMAAGIVIVREAGGLISDATGGDDMLSAGSIVAGNERIHAALLAGIADAHSD
jgi:myo-inositol-1(or 4)-monophosphatase